MDSKFIITGTGRCGTRYVADLLRTLGVKVGHEQIWNHTHLEPEANWGEAEGEVGWEAAAFLPWYGDANIVHLVRDPVKVINSRLATNWYIGEKSLNPNYRALYDFVDEYVGLEGLSMADKAAKHYVQWQKLIEAVTDVWYPIEAIDNPITVEMLLEDIGVAKRKRHWIDYALKSIPRNRNQHAGQVTVTWDWLWNNVSSDLFADLVDQAEKYDYYVGLSG